MSIHVLKIRLPGLEVAVSVNRPQRKLERRASGAPPLGAGRDQVAQRLPYTGGTEPTLMKWQV